jgi:hypothetical protein
MIRSLFPTKSRAHWLRLQVARITSCILNKNILNWINIEILSTDMPESEGRVFWIMACGSHQKIVHS